MRRDLRVHKLGEVLRAAREAKGVDLARVERETKIRERYLSALERGEYRELPGAVYTKGFLRNYGSYLGLDPEYLIDLYRLETSATTAERSRTPAPPRPLAVRRRRTFIITPGAVVAALLTIAVGALVAYIGYQLVTFARTPELLITDPVGDVSEHPVPEITIRGVTAPNARVTITGLPENPTVQADEDGRFDVTVGLLPGSNVIVIEALDPVTRRASERAQRTVVVVTDVAGSPSPEVGLLVLAQPTADATFTGPVALGGTAAPGSALQVTAALASQAIPTFTITDPAGTPVSIRPPAPPAPDPLALTADDAGAFSGELSLAAGTWDVTVTPEGGEPLTRRVVVAPADGLRGTLGVAGADSYLEVEQDGNPVAGVSGGIAADGERISLAANESLRIRAGNAGAVRISLNGIGIGPMGASGQVIEWLITRNEE